MTIIIIILSILWIYHRIKYINSGFSKFEYYLAWETNEIITWMVLIFEFLFIVFLIGFGMYYIIY